MKVLIIYPSAGIEERLGRKEPIGACYISAYLRSKGHETLLIDQYKESNDEILETARSFKPDVLGLSLMTYNFSAGLVLATKIKKDYKNIIVFVGGPHPSGETDVVKEDCIDFAIIGEGELSTHELIDALEKNRTDFENIKGICLYDKDSNKVIVTPPRERITDLDSLPFPDRTNLPMHEYRGREFKHLLNRRIGMIHTARGCSGNCTFCTTPMLYKGGWIARSAKNIVNEIEELATRYKVTNIFFADEDFMKDKSRVIQICDELMRRNLTIVWFCFAKITDVEPTILKRMRDAGCINIMVGIEAMHDESLKKISKNITADKTREAVAVASKTGLVIGGTYMLGYPWESHQDLLVGLEALKSLKLDRVYLNYITPFPGTPFYKDCVRKGLIRDTNFTHYDCYNPIVAVNLPSDFDYKEFRRTREQKINLNLRYAIKVFRNILRQNKRRLLIGSKQSWL